MPGIGSSLMSGLGASSLAAGSSVAGIAAMANPIGLAVGGLSLAGSLFGAGSDRKAAQNQVYQIRQQQIGLQDATKRLGEVVGMRTEMAKDIYGTGESSAMSQTGQSLYGLTRQGQGAQSRMGFANSEQLNTSMGRGQANIVESFGIQRQGLQDVLGQKLMDIAEFKGTEESRIDSERQKLRYEMEDAQRRSSAGGFFQSLLG
tara:strand:- start:6038 stop:6646 length:609 start_codon:yes stop_codon:yes gene_type:complete